jgi:hypothetical protein
MKARIPSRKLIVRLDYEDMDAKNNLPYFNLCRHSTVINPVNQMKAKRVFSMVKISCVCRESDSIIPGLSTIDPIEDQRRAKNP